MNYEANRLLFSEACFWTADETAGWWQRITFPVLVLHGEADPRPLGGAQRITDMIANAKLSVIPGAGHHLWRESAAEFAAILNRFLLSS